MTYRHIPGSAQRRYARAIGDASGPRDRRVGTGSWNDGPVAEKPEKPFMTKGAERLLVWSFLIPIILLAGTFIVLPIAR